MKVRALAHHLDHAPDAVVLRAGAGLHFSRIFFGSVPLDGTGCFLHWAAWWSKSTVAESQRHRPSGNAFHTISTSSSSAGTGPRLRPHPVRSLQGGAPVGLLLQGPLVLPVLPPEEGPALRGAAGREHPLSGAAPAFRIRHPHDAPPVLPLRPRFAQRPLPRRPRVPDRVCAHEPGPARRRPRQRHGHSHLRRVSGFPPPPARAGGRRAVCAFGGSSTSCPRPVSSLWRNSSAHG